MSIYKFVTEQSSPVGGLITNTHHYEFPNYVPNATELQEACDLISEDYRLALQASLHISSTFIRISARRVDVANLPETFFVPANAPWTGSVNADALSARQCGLLRFVGTTAYPRQSWIYLNGFTENSNTSLGRPDSNVITAMNNLGGRLLSTPITGQPTAFRVAVKYQSNPRVVTAWNPVSLFSSSDRWKTQKRRER